MLQGSTLQFFLHFLSVTRKKTEAKERVRKRPELGGRLSDFSSHSMRSSSARLARPRREYRRVFSKKLCASRE